MKPKPKSTTRSAAAARGGARVTRSRSKPAPQSPDRHRGDHVELSTILVPVDFSAGSLKALDFAVTLARRFDASVELLHVLDPIYSRGHFDSPSLRPMRTQALADAKRHLARLAKQRVQPHASVVHRAVLGVAYAVIVEAAAESGADVIVMGSEGRTGVNRFLVGSVAEKVVRHARCPVLVVR